MCMVCSYSTEVMDMEEEDQGPARPQRTRRKTSTRDLLTSAETSPDQNPGDCVTFQPREGGVLETVSRETVTGATRRDSQPSTPAAARCVVLPGGTSQGASTGEAQAAMDVLGRAREAQQRTRQSRTAGGRGDEEGAQATWPQLSSSSPLRKGQLLDTVESIEEKSRADISMVSRDEQEMVSAKAVVRAPSHAGPVPQEQNDMCALGEGVEEDGTPSPSRQAQGSRRVTFALWEEGAETEVDEGRTKAMVTRSERSLQYMEEASMSKQAWTQHLKEMEEAEGRDREPEQDLRQLRDKDQAETLLSLLTRTSKGRDFTRSEMEDLLREGRVWIESLMQPCLQEVRGWKGEAS
jgi:hypothetical protein